jgi:hypothetical protein
MMRGKDDQEFDIDWLTALEPSDVDFTSLPEHVVEQLALGTEPNFATLAIVELRRRDSPLAADTAIRLLSSVEADRYLKSAALSVLFDADDATAVRYMLVHAGNADPCLVNAMMEIMIRGEGCFRAENGSRLVPLVMARLKTISDEEYPRKDVRELFEEIYGQQA